MSEAVVKGDTCHIPFKRAEAVPQLPNPGIGLHGFAVACLISLQE